MLLVQKVSEKDIWQGLKYAKAFMMESFRVTPTASGGRRVLLHDIAIRGYHIPAGTFTFWTPQILGRDPKSFPDPDVFRPGRTFRVEILQLTIRIYLNSFKNARKRANFPLQISLP